MIKTSLKQWDFSFFLISWICFLNKIIRFFYQQLAKLLYFEGIARIIKKVNNKRILMFFNGIIIQFIWLFTFNFYFPFYSLLHYLHSIPRVLFHLFLQLHYDLFHLVIHFLFSFLLHVFLICLILFFISHTSRYSKNFGYSECFLFRFLLSMLLISWSQFSSVFVTAYHAFDVD